MQESNPTPEGKPASEQGLEPETTQKIPDDRTPTQQDNQSGLLRLIRSNRVRIASAVLLTAAIFGGNRLYHNVTGGGNTDESVAADSELSYRAKAEQMYYQDSARSMFAKIERDNLNPAHSMEKGKIFGFDEKGHPLEEGTIDVKAYPGNKYSDGTKVPVIAKLPIGTEIKWRIVGSDSVNKDDPTRSYYEFSCDDVEGDFLDAKVEEKIIQLDDNTICVVPWTNVARLN